MHDILLRNALIADPEADSLRTGDVAGAGGCTKLSSYLSAAGCG